MATEPKRKSAKSETLTIRLDPKTRFMLEFVSRLRGQTITTVVERAISKDADQAVIQGQFSDSSWRQFWDVVDGVRALRIAKASALYPTYEEERLLHFAERHDPFFMYKTSDGLEPGGPYIELLWPKVGEYLAIWEATKSTDHWAAGKRMANDLLAAGVKPPEWPRPSAPATGTGSKKASSQLDDDIPF